VGSSNESASWLSSSSGSRGRVATLGPPEEQLSVAFFGVAHAPWYCTQLAVVARATSPTNKKAIDAISGRSPRWRSVGRRQAQAAS